MGQDSCRLLILLASRAGFSSSRKPSLVATESFQFELPWGCNCRDPKQPPSVRTYVVRSLDLSLDAAWKGVAAGAVSIYLGLCSMVMSMVISAFRLKPYFHLH